MLVRYYKSMPRIIGPPLCGDEGSSMFILIDNVMLVVATITFAMYKQTEGAIIIIGGMVEHNGSITTKNSPRQRSYDINLTGGPPYTFLEHLSTEKLIEDLTLLYANLLDLGMGYKNGRAYLSDIEETTNFDPG